MLLQYAEYSKKLLGCFKGYLREAIAVVDVAVARAVARRHRGASLLLSVTVALSMCKQRRSTATEVSSILHMPFQSPESGPESIFAGWPRRNHDFPV